MDTTNRYTFFWKKKLVSKSCISVWVLKVMDVSKARHTLAVLRITAGLTQKEFADLVGVKPPTIQSIESNSQRLKLSESLGAKVAEKTGVSLAWLMANDTKAPIVDEHNEPYTKKKFDDVQSMLEVGVAKACAPLPLNGLIAAIAASSIQAMRDDRMGLFVYKLTRALVQIKKEFPFAEGVVDEMLNTPTIRQKEGAAKAAKMVVDEMLANSGILFIALLERCLPVELDFSGVVKVYKRLYKEELKKTAVRANPERLRSSPKEAEEAFCKAVTTVITKHPELDQRKKKKKKARTS